MDKNLHFGLTQEELEDKAFDITDKIIQSKEFEKALPEAINRESSQFEAALSFALTMTKDLVPMIIAKSIAENNKVISQQISEFLENK